MYLKIHQWISQIISMCQYKKIVYHAKLKDFFVVWLFKIYKKYKKYKNKNKKIMKYNKYNKCIFLETKKF